MRRRIVGRCERTGLGFELRESGRTVRNLLAVGLLLAILGTLPPAKAQEKQSKLELSAGCDYVRYNANPRVSGVPPSESFNANGVSAQIEYNANNWLGGVADFSGYAVARQGLATTHQISYLFGPRISVRRSRVTLFAQDLLGRVWAEDGITFGSVSEFGMTTGGGVDVTVSRHIAIRAVQAEYFLTKFPDGNNNRQNNFRFSTAIVIRLGVR
jgi:opacity protein-like surface antigen